MAPNGPEYALPTAPPPQFGPGRDGKSFGKKPFPNKQFQGKPPFPNKPFNPTGQTGRPYPPRQAFSEQPVEKPAAVKKSLTSPLSVSQDRHLAEALDPRRPAEQAFRLAASSAKCFGV
ncbi:MAG: hypothetical protein QM754_10570 [Tepidisphaeraceae bacterium]